jgi:hypothetical protein
LALRLLSSISSKGLGIWGPVLGWLHAAGGQPVSEI